MFGIFLWTYTYTITNTYTLLSVYVHVYAFMLGTLKSRQNKQPWKQQRVLITLPIIAESKPNYLYHFKHDCNCAFWHLCACRLIRGHGVGVSCGRGSVSVSASLYTLNILRALNFILWIVFYLWTTYTLSLMSRIFHKLKYLSTILMQFLAFALEFFTQTCQVGWHRNLSRFSCLCLCWFVN